MPDDDDVQGATLNETTKTTTKPKKKRQASGIGRSRARGKRVRAGSTKANFFNRNEVRLEVPVVKLRVMVDDELVSNSDEDGVRDIPSVPLRGLDDDEVAENPDEVHPDDDQLGLNRDEADPDNRLNYSDLDEHQVLRKKWRAGQKSINHFQVKLEASREKVIGLNKVVACLKEELENSKEVIKRSKIIVTKSEVSSQIEMIKNKTALEKLEASSAKTLCTLDQRTERFAVYRKKKDAEISMLRNKKRKEVETLDRKHAAKLAKVESHHFKQKRAQTREIVSLKCDAVERTTNVTKEASLLVDDYRTKLFAIE